MAKPKVLIVDDDPSIRDLYAARFRKAKFEVVVATNGNQAVEQALVTQPDVILLDLMMPVKGGLGALEVLKTMPESRDIPVIVLTAYPIDEYKEKSTRYGAVHFFPKAETMPGDLVTKVQELINNR